MGKPDNPIKCAECKSTFIRQNDLIKHIKRFHPKKAKELIATSENKDEDEPAPCKCEKCGKAFSNKRFLNSHEKTHSPNYQGVKIQKKCPLCDYIASFKKDFYDHCLETHQISLDVEKLFFTNIDEFMSWKLRIEKDTNSNFVKEYVSTSKMTNYFCDQSEFTVLENGIETVVPREHKVVGFCPAGFRVMHENNKSCSIYYVKTHICRMNKKLNFPNEETMKKENQDDKTEKPATVNRNNNEQKNIINVPNEKASKLNDFKKKHFQLKKKEFIKGLMKTLNSISTSSELNAMKELTNPIKPILRILRKKAETEALKDNFKKKENPNK